MIQPHNHRSYSLVAAAATLAVTTLLSTAAQADPKACITAHASGQREAKAGHLRLATQLFTSCGSDETCPGPLRHECADFLQEVLQTMPTVIFSVNDDKGMDVTAVKVFSTDELLVDGLDGRAIQIDPGKHRLRFLMPSGAVVSSDVLIREGEKSRVIRIKLDEGAPEDGAQVPDSSGLASTPPTTSGAKPPPPSTQPPPASPPEPAHRQPSVAAWVAGGTAVAALGLGATFAILGSSKKSDIDACSPNCGSDMRSSYDSLKRDYLIADIGFAVGLVSAGVATWLFLSPSASESGPATAAQRKRLPIRVGATSVPTGGLVVVDGAF